METISWLKKHWLSAALCAYLACCIMTEQGSFLINMMLLTVLLVFAFRPKRTQSQIVTLLTLLILVLLILQQRVVTPRLFLQKTAQTPPPALDKVQAEVYLGGEKFLVMPMDRNLASYSSVAAFHTDNGLTLATAHGVGYSSGEALVKLMDSQDAQTEYCSLYCTDYGVIFPTLRQPRSERLTIANVSDIQLADAQVHRQNQPAITLAVRGYYQADDITFLVLWGEDPCRPGYSGSPIVQNGKLIGSVYGYLRANKHIWLARLAADLYQQISHMTP